jgi:hypothetical protein
MPASSTQPWLPGPAGPGYRRHFRYDSGDVRASDAERADVADQLSRHYQDGRLDQAEFNERLDRAMNAKTRGDFAGLFADLPELPDDQADRDGQAKSAQVRVPRHRPRPALARLMPVTAIVIVAIICAHVLMHSAVLWVMVAVLACCWLSKEERRRRR